VALSGLFGKKKTREPETRERSSRDPARSDESSRDSSGSSASSQSRREPNHRSPPALSPRDIARATAEKIDLIESQIESEIMQSRSDQIASRGGFSDSTDPDRSRNRTNIGTTSINSSSTDLLGGSHLAHSMVLTDSGNPVLEEAAILYANGQDLPAVSVLASAVMDDKSPDTWLMLLELYQSLGKRAEFENLAIDFAVRFETSAPAWSDEQTRKPLKPAAAPAPRSAIVFKGALDARIVPQLEQLKKLAQRNLVLHLEFDQVDSVDPAGADLILRVFAAFQKSNHEVAIRGASQLAERLRAAIEVGRRDASNAVWMLLLEIYRILGRQAAFEETSIDYCVTFEVSPPSWEPASPKYLVDENAKAPSPVPAPQADEEDVLGPDAIALGGELIGKSDDDLQRLTVFATTHDRIVVDCSRLVRVDFTAAGLLLNWAVGMRGSRKNVEFVNVGHLVAALFVVMGLHEVVPIERRRV
jgi:ABC-type transporter Mla MlaB component